MKHPDLTSLPNTRKVTIKPVRTFLMAISTLGKRINAYNKLLSNTFPGNIAYPLYYT
jgi:hypothetical protein